MTKMEVCLDNIEYNLRNIEKKLNKSTNIIAMIKADAYGLGDKEVARFLESKGINFFGVAYVKEAVDLRKSGILSDILVTSQFLEDDTENIVDYDITVSISNLKYLDKLNDYAKKKDKIVNVHLKIETGMGRLGFSSDDIEKNISTLLDFSNICLDGIYTHLSCADTDKDYTLRQLHLFENTVNGLSGLGLEFSYIHALNSAGILNFNDYQFNTVRVGDILYGYYPDDSLKKKISLKPSVKIVSKIVHINNYKKGCKISYNGTYITSKASKIAVVSMGYADGLFRNLSNNYEVEIKGKKCKIVGNICMDMFMCDITGITGVDVGDEVIILNLNDDIYNMAKIAGTINYEIISRISKRVERVYIAGKNKE